MCVLKPPGMFCAVYCYPFTASGILLHVHREWNRAARAPGVESCCSFTGSGVLIQSGGIFHVETTLNRKSQELAHVVSENVDLSNELDRLKAECRRLGALDMIRGMLVSKHGLCFFLGIYSLVKPSMLVSHSS